MFNDLTAPRFNQRKFRHNIVSKELHKRWKQGLTDKGLKVPFGVYRRIWCYIADMITESILEERDGVRLRGLGDLYVGYTPKRDKPVDYKLSQQYGKTIYHENWHSDGKVLKAIWGVTGRRYILKRKYWWKFDGCRNFTRAISRAARETPLIYKNTIEKRNGRT